MFVTVTALWFIATWVPLGKNDWWNATADVSSSADALLESVFGLEAVQSVFRIRYWGVAEFLAMPLTWPIARSWFTGWSHEYTPRYNEYAPAARSIALNSLLWAMLVTSAVVIIRRLRERSSASKDA